jgi:acyl-CoA dehydrogenase
MAMLPGLSALASYAISRSGSSALASSLLPELMEGKCKVGIAVTEAEAGFNLFGMKTSATKRGNEYILNGLKSYASGVDICDYMFLLARTTSREDAEKNGLGKTGGISAFLVSPKLPGTSIEKMPTRGEGSMSQFQVRFDSVAVTEKHLIGKPDAGLVAAFPAFNIERMLFTGLGIGLSRFCLKRASEYASTRKTFSDDSIGSYQGVQYPLADAQIRQDAARALLSEAVDAFESQESPAKVAQLANKAKYVCNEMIAKSLDAAMIATGAWGMNEDSGLIQISDTVRLFQLSPIANNLILNDVAERMLGLPRSY